MPELCYVRALEMRYDRVICLDRVKFLGLSVIKGYTVRAGRRKDSVGAPENIKVITHMAGMGVQRVFVG